MENVAALIDVLELEDLAWDDVRGLQIIKALLAEVQVQFAKGKLYRTIQDTANEARERGLLYNPGRDTDYSTSVGDTRNMRPSEDGWEQTKGILYRRLQIARNEAARDVRDNLRGPLQGVAGAHRGGNAARQNPWRRLGSNRDEVLQAGAGPMELAATTRSRTFSMGPAHPVRPRPRR